jgi:cysteinyl-tRNA synthetase
MKVYDTLKKSKVEFKPQRSGKIGIYLCGPTVYDYGHLGHGRSAIVFDLLRRYLIYKGFDVTFVRNWTDIDDKTIERAKEENVTVRELTQKFIHIYEEDYAKLNILEPDFAPKPTEHIADMIGFIELLFDKGHAYRAEDGVYYDISTFPDYGSLSGQSIDELRGGVRVEITEQKRNPGDFVLWKFEKPGEPTWNSPWGKGRPGWHIECSVMSVGYLGERFDIHCGGQDLIFPHHEDEIAQSRGAGYGFARYWMHNGFLNIDDEKMSKSLGNFFALREIFEHYSPLTVRFFLLSAHYRAPLNFTDRSLGQAQNTLGRYNDFIMRVNEIAGRKGQGYRDTVEALIRETRSGFENGLEDDLNISKSLASLSGFVREINNRMDRGNFNSEDALSVVGFMKEIDQVLAVFTFSKEILPEEIEELIDRREKARAAKNFLQADRIRKNLLERGILLEDTKEGPRWKRKS